MLGSCARALCLQSFGVQLHISLQQLPVGGLVVWLERVSCLLLVVLDQGRGTVWCVIDFALTAAS